MDLGMGFIKIVIVFLLASVTLVGVLSRVLNFKKITGNVIKKTLWFILSKSIQNAVELNKIRLSCYCKKLWRKMFKSKEGAIAY